MTMAAVLLPTMTDCNRLFKSLPDSSVEKLRQMDMCKLNPVQKWILLSLHIPDGTFKLASVTDSALSM